MIRTTREDVLEALDDTAPVEMLAQLFEARGWACEALATNELAGEAPGSWATYQVKAIYRPEDRVLQLLCLPEIRIGEAKRATVDELVGLINEQVWLGHFECWSQGNVLVFRHALMLGEDGSLPLQQAQDVVEAAVAECDRFYPAFQFALWGDKAPRAALDAAMVDAAGEA